MNLQGSQFEMFWKQYDMWEEDFYSAVLDPVSLSENPAESQADGYVDPGCWRCGKLESDHCWDGDKQIAYCDEMDRDEFGGYWGDPMRTYSAAPMEPLYSDEAEPIREEQ